MMSRQEKERCPVVVQEPQRVIWSRVRTAFGVTPRRAAWRVTAPSMSRPLALQEIDDAAAEMGRLAGNIERRAVVVLADGHRTTAAGTWRMVWSTPRSGTGQPSAIGIAGGKRSIWRLQPAGVALEEAVRLGQRPALRHGEDGRLARAGDAQRVAPRARMAADVDGHIAALGGDLEAARPAVRTGIGMDTKDSK